MPDLIGLLDSRVTILRATETEGSMGVKVGARAAVGTRWASVRPDRGTTALEGKVPVDRCDLIVTLRADTLTKTLTIEDRIAYGGHSYVPRSVEPPNRQTGRITCYLVREAD
jgi:head-tail adaptor